jgi:hypothetical protein
MRLALFAVLPTLLLPAPLGCSNESPGAAGSAKPSAGVAPPAKSASTPASAPPTASAAPPAAGGAPPAPAARPPARAPPPARAAPRSDCPKDSGGPGTFDQPCLGKGNARMMEVKWTGKTDDKGPSFRVINKSPSVILFGKIAVFFYDKAGKQLETKERDKAVPFKSCSGNIFSGIMKVDEKAVITFSCVSKADVPEGTAAIEGEMITVGFADASEKKSEFYWTNPDLAPAARPKGGVK